MSVASISQAVREIETAPVYEQPLVEIQGLEKRFPVKGGILQRTVAEVKAVDGVDLTIRRGEALGLVGESAAARRP